MCESTDEQLEEFGIEFVYALNEMAIAARRSSAALGEYSRDVSRELNRLSHRVRVYRMLLKSINPN